MATTQAYPYLENLITDLTPWALSTSYIPTFGLLMACGIFAGVALTRRRLIKTNALGIKPKIDPDNLETVIFISLGVSLIGAKIFHAVEYLEYGFANQFFSRSGFSIYGGVIFGLITAIWLMKRRSIPVIPVLDLIAPSLMMGYAIGRIGCQLSGDGDWGMATNLGAAPGWLPEWCVAQTYENNIAGVSISAPGVYPTPLYETLAAVFGWLLLTRLRTPLANFPASLFGAYLVLSGISRFAVETIRINPTYTGLDWSQAQFIAVAGGLIGIALLFRALRTPTQGH